MGNLETVKYMILRSRMISRLEGGLGRGCGPVLVCMLVVAVILSLFCSCKGMEYITIEKVRTDTVYKSKTIHDSVRVHDSIQIEAKGDTIYIERWHTREVEKERTDTVYKHKTDSIPVPYRVEVPAKLTVWEKVKVAYGGYAIAVIVIMIVITLLFIYLRKFVLMR